MKKKVTEETRIKREIKDFLKVLGFYVFPILQGLGAHKGIADLCAIGYGMTAFIEVKTSRGNQSEYQVEFEKEVKSHGGHYILARGYEDIKNYFSDNNPNFNRGKYE